MNNPHFPRRVVNKSCFLLWLLFVSVCTFTSALGQTPKIQLTESVLPEAQDAIKIAFKVSGASQKRIRVTVAAGGSAVTSDEIRFANDGEHVVNVNLFKGDNTITLVGFVNDEPVDNLVTPLKVKCNGRWCKEPFSLKPDTVASEFKEGGGVVAPTQGGGGTGQGGPKPTETTAQKGAVHINKPKKDVHYVDATAVPLTVAVDQQSDTAKNVKTVFVTVLSDGQPVIQKENPVKITYPTDPTKPGALSATIKIGKGTNHRIMVFDPTQPESQRDEVQIICEGDKCGGATVASATQGIRITSPEGGAQFQDAPYVLSKITVKKDSSVTKLFVRVLNNGKPIEKPLVGDGDSLDVTFAEGTTEAVLTPKIKVGNGTNVITVFDAAKSIDESPQDSTEITCSEKCGEAVATQAITIEQPKNPVNISSIPATVSVDKDSGIKKIKYYVRNGENLISSKDITVPALTEGKPTAIPVNIRIAKGTNTVTFVDAEKEDDRDHQAEAVVVCSGDNCAEDFLIARYSGSQNSRAIVGFEQAGSSSAGSETKPVLDFFFQTPFLYDRRKPCKEGTSLEDCADENDRRRLLPRLGFWGDIRLASTPEQVAAAQVFPTRLVNQVTTPGQSVDLVQSFDFLAGLEGRIKTANGSFLSLIPGMPQKSSLYWTFGGGAISPLSARREAVQIFNIPGVNDPRREEFINRFGLNGTIPLQPGVNPAKEKEFLAISPIDRDRFFHQWYAGIRLKTFYCDNPSCTRYKNSFPAIVDVAIGQNEAVTGGSRKRGGTPDPNNPDKLIGRRNSYVLRLDGFYPFPLKEASFIYFYGTALMKIGGGGVKITTPLFLDNTGTTIELSDPRVYIPPTSVLKLQQPDRDYYKIGVGVNLTDLFNRNKEPE